MKNVYVRDRKTSEIRKKIRLRWLRFQKISGIPLIPQTMQTTQTTQTTLAPLSYDLYEQFQVRYHGRVPELAWRCLEQFCLVPCELLEGLELDRPWLTLPLANSSTSIHPLLRSMGFCTTITEFLNRTCTVELSAFTVNSTRSLSTMETEFLDPHCDYRWNVILRMIELAPRLGLESVARHFSQELAQQLVHDYEHCSINS